jgi:hypothetical protein
MATWQTPVTDWISTDIYQYTDIDRVEQNTEYLKDEFEAIGYTASATTFDYPRTRARFGYKTEMNRIENNILAIKTATWEPLVWITPVVSWLSVSQSFSYVDANRLEQNILYLYEMLQNVTDAFLYCGDNMTTICGKGNTLF